MALQVCSRCRKRRIRCDLQLPACKNCQVADIECFFWDDAQAQEISCSYLHSLQQKKLRLEFEIQRTRDNSGNTLASPTNDTACSEQGYHLSNSDEDFLAPARTVYLGSGSSARFLERCLTDMINWHILNNVQIPERMTIYDSSQLIDRQITKPSASFSVVHGQGKLELQNLVAPATQRAIIEHYLKTISPEYPLISKEGESKLLEHENPLKWSASNKGDSGALALSIVFAISSTLITRDLDSSFSSISIRCEEEIRKISETSVSSIDEIPKIIGICMTLCALVLCKSINPTSGQIWDCLGRAITVLEDLREGYQLKDIALDQNFRRLERLLLKLESSLALHLRRPSPFCAMRLRTTFEDLTMSDALVDELNVLSHLRNITHHMNTLPRPTEVFFENLIPPSMKVDSIQSSIDVPSARLYVALHPLFTTLDVCRSGRQDNYSSSLFHVAARSASTLIDHFAQLNHGNMIISIWMAAEQVFEAGLVWISYLMSQHGIVSLADRPPKTNLRFTMGPILKISTLFASFAARWKGGLSYLEAWEAVVELLWNIL